MDKKRIARRVLLTFFAVIFVLSVVSYAHELVSMFNDRVHMYYQGELYQAHRVLGAGYTLPDDAEYIGDGIYVKGGKKQLKSDLETTLNRQELRVYLSTSNPGRLYVEENFHGQRDVYIFFTR